MKETHKKKLMAFAIGVLALLALAVLILYFIFRPRPPVVIPTPVSLLHFDFSPDHTIIHSIIMGVDVLLKNRNLAPFIYYESAAVVYYHDVLVGEAPIAAGRIGARKTEYIGTPVELLVDRLVDSPEFLPDVTAGLLSLIATSKTRGRATILGFVKLRAMIAVECHVSVFVWEGAISSKCISSIKLG
ncbi:NDR1/HIN1-like protein 2 [Asparagus officinalis]|uniref:NDR1/HIN1-like protein 2 n=1 Tax=Asparagus officinalis TaxID=4686 RepID=UPI00098E12A7|nr:NDR1/HIN1-like protein 2 [Asparagus officinalis]